MLMANRWLLLASLTTLGLSACDKGDDDHGHDDHSHATETGHETGDTHETGEVETCEAETRDDEFAIGLSKSGSLVQASFVSADPAPPIKGDNTWVLELEDLQGEPLTGVTIVAIPMMPDHGHGTAITTEVTALEVPGRYQLTPVNLFMTGFWEITLELTLAGGETDSLVFGFCVE
jgi:hypothetical protein